MEQINLTMCTAGATLSSDYGTLLCGHQLAAGIPGGSWAKSCAPMSWDGSTLTAYCQPASQTYTTYYTTLEFESCFPTSGVINVNGALACSHAAATAPPGTWSAPGSCSGSSWDDDTGILAATCTQNKKSSGFTSYTALNYTLCKQGTDVNNMNGLMQCFENDFLYRIFCVV